MKMCEVFNNKYYHISANCIQSRNPLFCKSSICIPPNLKLTMEQMEYFRLFRVDLSSDSAQKYLINLNNDQKYIFPFILGIFPYQSSPMNYGMSSAFVSGLTSHSKSFHSYGNGTITDEGLQSGTYVRHTWPLTSEGSLACHTYFVRGILI